MRTSCDIKAGKDCIFKKYLNAGYPKAFIYSVLNIRTKITLGLQN